jgi:hypothetical protein
MKTKTKRKRPVYRKKKCVVCGAIFQPRSSISKVCGEGCRRVRKRADRARCDRAHPQKRRERQRCFLSRLKALQQIQEVLNRVQGLGVSHDD